LIENVGFKLNKFIYHFQSLLSLKPLQLLQGRVARPRFLKDIPRCNIDPPNISNPNVPSRHLN
jgi:hypothetical protein